MPDDSLLNAEARTTRLLSDTLPGSADAPLRERWNQLPRDKSIEIPGTAL